MNGDNVQPIIEIFSKFSLFNQILQIFIGGHNQAKVAFHRPDSSDPLYFLFFQDAEQLGLHIEREIGDFIKKDGSLVRQLELAQACPCFPPP